MIEAHEKRHFSKEKERCPFPISYSFFEKPLCTLCLCGELNSYKNITALRRKPVSGLGRDALHDDRATGLDDLRPAFREERSFFEQEYRVRWFGRLAGEA